MFKEAENDFKCKGFVKGYVQWAFSKVLILIQYYVAEMIENEFVQSNFRILLEFGIPKSAVQKIQVLFELNRFTSKDMTEDEILSIIAAKKDFLKKYLSAYEMEIVDRAI